MRSFITTLLLLFTFQVPAQRVQYSHQTIRNNTEDAVRLIANIGSQHHVMVLHESKRPEINVYNQSLQLQTKQVIPAYIPEKFFANFFTLKNHYYFFLGTQKSRNSSLWKIDSQGNCKNMMPAYRQLMQQQFLHDNTMVHLFTDNNHLNALTYLPNPHSGQLQIKHVVLDSGLKAISQYSITLSLEGKSENLKQIVSVNGQHLLLLLQKQNGKTNHSLEIINWNLSNKVAEKKQIDFPMAAISAPGMQYNAYDSTIVVYAVIHSLDPNENQNYRLFISRIYPNTLPVQSVAADQLAIPERPFCFVLMGGITEKWLKFSAPSQSITTASGHKPALNNPLYSMNNDSVNFFRNQTFTDYNIPYVKKIPASQLNYSYGYQTKTFYERQNFSTLDFFTVNRQFELSGEHSLFSERKDMEVIPLKFGVTQWRNKSLLILKQILRRRKTGLLMIYYDDQQLKAADLPLYEHYNYILQQMKPCNDGSVIIPYINKNETGLVKLRWDELKGQ